MASALSPQNTTLCRICSCATAIRASAASCHRFHSGIAPGSLKAAPRRNWTHEGSPRTEHQSLPVRIRKSCHALLIPPVCCGRKRRRRKVCLDGRGRTGHPRAGRAARHRRPARKGGRGGGRHRRGPYERRYRSPRRGRATRWCLVGGKAPSKRAVDVSLLNRAGPGPHTAAPSPWTGATSSPPGPPSKNHWVPRPLLQGPLPLAARLRREHQRPAARLLPQEDPTGRHQPHADPTGARSTQPTTPQTPRLENP